MNICENFAKKENNLQIMFDITGNMCYYEDVKVEV